MTLSSFNHVGFVEFQCILIHRDGENDCHKEIKSGLLLDKDGCNGTCAEDDFQVSGRETQDGGWKDW